MTATLMLARHDVIEGPADQVSVSKSNTSVVHKDWHPSDPPTTTNLSVIINQMQLLKIIILILIHIMI